MENQELLKYIEDAQVQGYSKDEIRDTLLNVGWRIGEIKDAFYIINESNNAKFSEAGSKKQKFIIFIGIAIAIFLFGSSAFGGYYYYQTIPVRAIKKAQENLDHVEAVKYKMIGSIDTRADKYSEGIDVTITAQGAFDKIDKEDVKGSFDINANVDIDVETSTKDGLEVLTQNSMFAVSFKTVDGMVYVKLDIPTMISSFLPLDANAINNQWIEFDQQSIKEFSDNSDSIKMMEMPTQPFNETWRTFKEYNLFDAKYVKSEEIDGVETRRLSFSVNKDELARFWADECEEKYSSETSDINQCVETYSKTNDVIQKITGECWIGKKDGFIYRLTVNADLKNDEAEGTMKLKIELSDFNKPINVTAPVKTKKYEELGIKY